MSGTETLWIALAAEGGSVFAALIGYLRNKEINPETPFKWNSLLLASLLGVGAALAYALALTGEWSIAAMFSAFLGGMGFSYGTQKTVGALPV